MHSASKLPDENVRERTRSGLNDLSVHEQCIDFHRTEVPIGENTNERPTFQISLRTDEA